MINEHLSYSRTRHIFCPLRYYINYIENYSYCSSPLIIGSLIHKYYEEYIFFPEHFTWLKDKERAIKKIKDDCIQYFIDSKYKRKMKLVSENIFDDSKLDSIAHKIYYLFEPNISNRLKFLYLSYIKDGRNIKIELEKEYNFPIENETRNRFKYFKFIPDISLIISNKNQDEILIVIDIKTGSKYKSYDSQLNIYSFLLKTLKAIPTTLSYIYYVKNNELEIIPQKYNFFQNFINEINNFLDYFKINNLEDYKNFVNDFFENKEIFKQLNKFKPENERCLFCFLSDWCPYQTNFKYSLDDILDKLEKLHENVKILKG